MVNGSAVNLVYSCLGYGVTSFWIAFVFANNGSWKRKWVWMTGGALALWIINVLRIGLVLVANNKNWGVPLGLNHHTWFNMVAYMLIFILIYFYDRSLKQASKKTDHLIL